MYIMFDNLPSPVSFDYLICVDSKTISSRAGSRKSVICRATIMAKISVVIFIVFSLTAPAVLTYKIEKSTHPGNVTILLEFYFTSNLFFTPYTQIAASMLLKNILEQSWTSLRHVRVAFLKPDARMGNIL